MKEKVIIPGIGDMCCRCKEIAEEFERYGGRKEDDHGSGAFHNVCQDCVKIGGRKP